jgi:hypothetical protein
MKTPSPREGKATRNVSKSGQMEIAAQRTDVGENPPHLANTTISTHRPDAT